MNNIAVRLGYCLLGWGSVGLVYKATSLWQGKGILLHPSFIDRLISFSPLAVWPYLSFFLLIPLCYLLCPLNRVRKLAYCMQIAALCSGAIYFLWPTTMAYPELIGNGWSDAALRYLIAVDTEQNCLPSLHASLTLLAVLAVCVRGRPWRNTLFIIWGGVIAFSVLQLQRHLFIDLLTGGMLAIAVSGLYSQIQSRTLFKSQRNMT